MTRLHPFPKEEFRFGVELEYQDCDGYDKRSTIYEDGDEDSDTISLMEYVDNHVPRTIQSGEDTSVGGGELRHRDPLTYTQTLAAWTEVFRRNDLSIDEGCSLHIHMSIAGKTHSFGPELSKWMHYYIVSNTQTYPENIQERWRSGPRGNYFDIPETDYQAGDSRYCFIAFREGMDLTGTTWEFRCWGNVDTVEGITTCLEATVEAYNFAYQKCHRLHQRCPYSWEDISNRLEAELNPQEERAQA